MSINYNDVEYFSKYRKQEILTEIQAERLRRHSEQRQRKHKPARPAILVLLLTLLHKR